MSTHYFSWEGDRYGFRKKHVRTHYAALVFLHLVGSAGHVVHFNVSEAPKVYALFSCLGRVGSGSTKSAPGHISLNLFLCIRLDLWIM
jgi:hypothetical protein